MKTEHFGRQYSITFNGVRETWTSRGRAEYYSVDTEEGRWKGACIVQTIDGANPRAALFATKGDARKLEESLFRVSIREDNYFHSQTVGSDRHAALVDHEGLVDLMATKLLERMSDYDDIHIPIFTYVELRDHGIITENDGQMLLPLPCARRPANANVC